MNYFDRLNNHFNLPCQEKLKSTLQQTVGNVLPNGSASRPAKNSAIFIFARIPRRELGFTMVDPAPKLNISQPAVSMSARRGERIASENGYSLMDESNL